MTRIYQAIAVLEDELRDTESRMDSIRAAIEMLRSAPTIEARSDETEGLGPQGESVTAEGRGALLP